MQEQQKETQRYIDIVKSSPKIRTPTDKAFVFLSKQLLEHLYTNIYLIPICLGMDRNLLGTHLVLFLIDRIQIGP